jgi:hypothetical protein
MGRSRPRPVHDRDATSLSCSAKETDGPSNSRLRRLVRHSPQQVPRTSLRSPICQARLHAGSIPGRELLLQPERKIAAAFVGAGAERARAQLARQAVSIAIDRDKAFCVQVGGGTRRPPCSWKVQSVWPAGQRICMPAGLGVVTVCFAVFRAPQNSDMPRRETGPNEKRDQW